MGRSAKVEEVYSVRKEQYFERDGDFVSLENLLLVYKEGFLCRNKFLLPLLRGVHPHGVDIIN